MPIHVLPEQLASQIAAGEVVERPASLVKELIENSIDAGATTVNIDVRGGGRQLAQVADNGSGISSAEIELAFTRHATSKLNTAEDLRAIHTLGFRGEALAAIAAVSQVTIVSRAAGESAGTRLQLEGGRVIGREMMGAPRGTVLAVENLFYNVPARFKFLKSAGAERRLIDELVTRFALAYPGIRFRLTHDGRVTFQTAGSGRLADVLLTVYGPETVRQLHPLIESAPDARPGAEEEGPAQIEVSGYVSDPSLHWANRNQINLFVNGRYIRDSRLAFAAVQAYHTLLPTGRYPLALLFLKMPAEDVDVNVHPTKVEVRFRHDSQVFGAVQRAVRQTLLATTPVRALGGWPTTGLEGRPVGWSGAQDNAAFVRRDESPAARLALNWSPESYHGREAPTGAARPPEVGGDRLPLMRVIGQVGAAYIICEGPDGLFLIDQHAAHERILYEQFMAQRGKGQAIAQGLLSGATVHLTPAHAGLLEANLSLLRDLGFEIEPFGPDAFIVRAVPAILIRSDPAQAIQAVLSDLESERAPLQSEIEAMIVRRVCKSAAVKAGQTLSREEMEAMIAQLEACESPHTCPHGRPTLIHLSAAQLARHFGRD